MVKELAPWSYYRPLAQKALQYADLMDKSVKSSFVTHTNLRALNLQRYVDEKDYNYDYDYDYNYSLGGKNQRKPIA
jgi:hypothetical protein